MNNLQGVAPRAVEEGTIRRIREEGGRSLLDVGEKDLLVAVYLILNDKQTTKKMEELGGLWGRKARLFLASCLDDTYERSAPLPHYKVVRCGFFCACKLGSASSALSLAYAMTDPVELVYGYDLAYAASRHDLRAALAVLMACSEGFAGEYGRKALERMSKLVGADLASKTPEEAAECLATWMQSLRARAECSK